MAFPESFEANNAYPISIAATDKGTIERMPLPVYQTKLTNRMEVAERVLAVNLERPVGFEFNAGQNVDVTLLNPPEMDSQGVVRTSSIASAPYEDDLVVATRVRESAFKRVFATFDMVPSSN